MHVIDSSNNEIRGGRVKKDVGRDEKQVIKFAWPYFESFLTSIVSSEISIHS